jgi:AraC-like DNA-binding protein
MLLDTPQVLLFFLSGLGILNGLVLSTLTKLWVQNKQLSIILSGLFLFLTVRIGKSVALYFVPDISLLVVQVGLSACVMIGPMVYLSIKCISDRVSGVDCLFHFALPFILVIVIGVLFPFEQYKFVWRNAHKVIYHYWLIYLIVSAISLHRVSPVKKWSKLKWDSDEFLVVSTFCGNFLIWFSMYSFKYTSYIAGAVTFSFVTYLLLLLVSARLFGKRSQTEILTEKLPTVSGTQLELDKKIKELVLAEKFFVDSTLSLPKLARRLETTTHQLSSHMNSIYGKNFTSWLNDYRINEAKELLIAEKKLSVEVISELSGFNSTSTFYTAFKKLTGKTPSKYREVGS